MHNTSRVLFPLLAFVAALAQINTSNLDGNVKDQQGSLVPNAEVTVINTQTQQVFRSLTDNQGHWVIPSLPTAFYSVMVSARGFKKTTAPDVRLDAGIPATVNVALEVGAVTETVEVVGGAEVLQTSSAAVSSDLTGRQVHDLPIPSRNATDRLTRRCTATALPVPDSILSFVSVIGV